MACEDRKDVIRPATAKRNVVRSVCSTAHDLNSSPRVHGGSSLASSSSSSFPVPPWPLCPRGACPPSLSIVLALLLLLLLLEASLSAVGVEFWLCCASLSLLLPLPPPPALKTVKAACAPGNRLSVDPSKSSLRCGILSSKNVSRWDLNGTG